MPRRKKPGRPSLGDKARNQVLAIKVSREERSRWQDAADRRGITLGAWLREAAERSVKVKPRRRGGAGAEDAVIYVRTIPP